MKIPFWKKWLSYLSEIEIETISSNHNPVLSVFLKNGEYQLCTKEAVYSYGNLYTNFRGSFERLNFEKLSGNHALILGLGLGSIPKMLEEIFNREFKFTAVEIDEEVVYLAEKYVLSHLKYPISTVITDASVYINQCQETYDLITTDIFESDIIPEKFQTKHYLQQLSSCLSANGVLIYNQLADTKQDQRNAQKFYDETFKSVFPNSQVLKLKGNYMLISDEKFLK